MSQIEGSLGSASLGGQVVFAAVSGRAVTTGAGLGGVRSAMARAAQLLALDDADRLDVRPASTPTPRPRPARATAAGAGHGPARRRTRRYAERQVLRQTTPR